MRKPRLVGLAGTLGAGKDTASEILVSTYGYTHVSTGDAVRTEARRRYTDPHVVIDRPILHLVANEMRATQGAGALVLNALTQNADREHVVISGIRNIGEAQALKEASGLLLFIDAPIELRL